MRREGGEVPTDSSEYEHVGSSSPLVPKLEEDIALVVLDMHCSTLLFLSSFRGYYFLAVIYEATPLLPGTIRQIFEDCIMEEALQEVLGSATKKKFPTRTLGREALNIIRVQNGWRSSKEDSGVQATVVGSGESGLHRTKQERFCKRCCCCICHQFDNNMDASLWLQCTPDSGLEGSCGFSCHVECALRHRKLQLDGCYSCASCGKLSSIIGCLKKQLEIASDTSRVDVLCYRILLSYRLLTDTSKFHELRKFIEDLKSKLEMEVGPISVATGQMSRPYVGRLHAIGHVQALCMLASNKAEELLNSNSSSGLDLNVAESSVRDSIPQHKSREETKSDSRSTSIEESPRVILDRQRELQESCGIGVGDVQPEREQGRLLLPDLNEEFREADTTPPSTSNGSGGLDDAFENIVKTVCELEHNRLVTQHFRLKFLTWFSMRANEHERRIVRAFVQTMNKDLSGLAGQLIDAFSGIIFSSSW